MHQNSAYCHGLCTISTASRGRKKYMANVLLEKVSRTSKNMLCKIYFLRMTTSIIASPVMEKPTQKHSKRTPATKDVQRLLILFNVFFLLKPLWFVWYVPCWWLDLIKRFHCCSWHAEARRSTTEWYYFATRARDRKGIQTQSIHGFFVWFSRNRINFARKFARSWHSLTGSLRHKLNRETQPRFSPLLKRNASAFRSWSKSYVALAQTLDVKYDISMLQYLWSLDYCNVNS